MKSKFLKIAGVKSDKAFYKKYPTEAAFFKAHPEAKESIKKAQWGDLLASGSFAQSMQNLPDMQTMMQGQTQSGGVNAGMFPSNDYNKMYMGMSTADEQLSKSASPYEFSVSGMDKAMNKVDISKQSSVDANKGSGFVDQLSKMGGPAGQILGGILSIGEQKKETKRKKGIANATSVIADAAESTDVDALRQYTQNAERKRKAFMPEMTGEEFFPVYGVGTNVLRSSRNGIRLEDGGMVGGNPTEIQNTYGNGNSLYDDLEYEPLYNIDQIKSYRMGGYLPKAFDGAAMSGMMSSMGGGNPYAGIEGIGTQVAGSLTGNDAGGQIGGGLGKAATMITGIPGLETLGTLAGGLLDTNDRDQRKAEAKSKYSMDRTMASQFRNNLQGQFGSNMRDGGYMNPEYNPQVITMFGDHDDEDFADYAQKDQFRAGGHLKAYTPPSERAMETYAMGGELKTHWGGRAETMSQNPYLPGDGETVMFRGKSHDESDGKGNTGIGITYGDNPVEVERGEPAVKLKDGSSGEDSLVVYGNLKISKDAAKFIGDKKAEGMKYKNYIADKSKFETKQNKLIQKSTEELGELDPKDAYDKLKVAALEASIKGGEMNLKQVAEIKEKSAFSQNTINETAEKYGIVADDLARGKVKFDKEAMKKQAKFGASVPKAQYGLEVWEGNKTGLGKKTASEFTLDQWNQIAKKYGFKGKGNLEFQRFLMSNPETANIIKARHNMLYGANPETNPELYDNLLGRGYAAAELLDLPAAATVPKDDSKTTKVDNTDASFETVPYKRSGLLDFAGQLLPYIRPTDQEALNPNQLLGEMYAMSSNQEEGVQAIPVSKQLRVPYEINRNAAKNDLISQTRAAQRLAGYNPALQAYIASQAYSPMQQLNEQDFIDNQRMKDTIFSGNIQTLNDADAKNREIYDQQYLRQSQAKSNTKAIAQAALNSISDKYAKNALENKTLGIYENLYNYRYDNRGRAINMNAPFQANIPYIYGNDGKPTHKIIYAQDKKTILGYQPISKQEAIKIPSGATPAFNPNSNDKYNQMVDSEEEFIPIDESNEDIINQVAPKKNGGKLNKKHSQSSIVRAFK